jgi:hypothetical protein
MYILNDDIWGAYKVMQAGIDSSFDEESLNEYAKVVRDGEEAVDSFVDHWRDMNEQYLNIAYCL